MKKIKFRGKSKQSDKFVYGDLTHDIYCGFINTYIDCEPVNSETVAQFIGYDSDGNEVYEGDCLMTNEYDGDDSYYKPYKLKIMCDMGGGIYLMGHRFNGYSLWEESK